MVESLPSLRLIITSRVNPILVLDTLTVSRIIVAGLMFIEQLFRFDGR